MVSKKRPKKPAKGFKRSQKEWEASAARHLGKLIDRLDPMEVLTYLFAAYYGQNAFGIINPSIENRVYGAMYGMVGLKLASSNNAAAGAAGVTALAAIGLITAIDAFMKAIPTPPLPGPAPWH